MKGALPSRDRSHRSGTTGPQSDIEGLCLALSDWSAELCILQRDHIDHSGGPQMQENSAQAMVWRWLGKG